MTLHITDIQTDRLARKVAKRAGQSLTEAVRQSLAERWERLEEKDQEVENAKVKALLAIAARTSPEFRAEKKTGRELIEELYDEDGLPR